MKILYKLPEKFEKVLKSDNYYGRKIPTKRNYSVTNLLKDPRPVFLKERHREEIVEEVEDRLWAFFGTAFHTAMEPAEGDFDLTEQTLTQDRVRGRFDHYDAEEKTIYDFKFTSLWKMVWDDDDFLDFHKQLSIYAWLLEESGFPVKNVVALMVFRDWKRSDYRRGKHKVPKPFAQVDFEETLKEIDGFPVAKWAQKRVEYLDAFADIPDDELPYCSEEFRWASGDTFAVMKGTNKRAFRVLDTEEKAKALAEKMSKTPVKQAKGKPEKFVPYSVVLRPGEKFKRCEYCDVSDFCNQYQDFLKVQEINSADNGEEK